MSPCWLGIKAARFAYTAIWRERGGCRTRLCHLAGVSAETVSELGRGAQVLHHQDVLAAQVPMRRRHHHEGKRAREVGPHGGEVARLDAVVELRRELLLKLLQGLR